MSKEEFYKLPGWKQNNLKKSKDSFNNIFVYACIYIVNQNININYVAPNFVIFGWYSRNSAYWRIFCKPYQVCVIREHGFDAISEEKSATEYTK